MMRARCGSALTMVLVIIIVLDCIVAGTLYLALLEHRLGSNHVVLLRLRLAAATAIHRATAGWSAEADTMPIGPSHRLELATRGDESSVTTHVRLERLDERLFLVSAEAVALAPRPGRSRARVLIRPPALPPDIAVAPAAVSAGNNVYVQASAEITSAAPVDCDGEAVPFAIIVSPTSGVVIDPAASLDGGVGVSGPNPLHSALDRVMALAQATPAALVIHGDTVMDAVQAGVVIADGDLTLKAPAVVRGLVLANGTVTVEAGAGVVGAVHSATDVIVAGAVRRNECAVIDAIDSAGLERPAWAGRRAWMPSF